MIATNTKTNRKKSAVSEKKMYSVCTRVGCLGALMPGLPDFILGAAASTEKGKVL